MRRIALVALAISLGLGLVCASLAPADDAAKDSHGQEPGDSHSPGKTGQDSGAKKMFGFEHFLDLAIWTWVVFLLLFWVLSRYAWKPMLEGLRKREQNIAQAIEDAENARRETQALHASLEARINQASQQVAEMLAEARRDAEVTKAQMIADARAEAQAERDRLQREMRMARDQAVQEIWKQAAQLATLISTKAIRKQLSLEDHRHLVDEALSDMKEAVSEARHFMKTGGA